MHSESDPPPPTPPRKLCEDCGIKIAIYPTASDRGTTYRLPGEDPKRWCTTCARGHDAHPNPTRPTSGAWKPGRTKRGQKRERSRSPDGQDQQQHGGDEQPLEEEEEGDLAASSVARAAAAAAETGGVVATSRAPAAQLLRARIKAKGSALRAARAAGQDVRALLAELSLLQAEIC